MQAINALFLLERAMGVTQHHDAVSGTSKQHVAFDYAKRLARGRIQADILISNAFANMTGYTSENFISCDLTNVTICPPLETASPSLYILYNQLSAVLVNETVRIPVGFASGISSYVVYDGSATPTPAQLLPLSASDIILRDSYYSYTGLPASAVQWLAFTAPAVPALGYVVFFLVPTSEVSSLSTTTQSTVEEIPFKSTPVDISNGIIKVEFDGTTGLIKSYTNLEKGINISFSQNFWYYNSSCGEYPDDNTGDNSQASGAYIFRPNMTTAALVTNQYVALSLMNNGPLVWEVRQQFTPWLAQTVRLSIGSPHIEFEYTIGPVPTMAPTSEAWYTILN